MLNGWLCQWSATAGHAVEGEELEELACVSYVQQ